MNPFIGEIRMFCGNFAPLHWAFCNGQLMNISQNSTLFGILGTFYGGDGRSTFALPNLQGRVPMNAGTSVFGTDYFLGQSGGHETETLLVSEIPAHNHGLNATPSPA